MAWARDSKIGDTDWCWECVKRAERNQASKSPGQCRLFSCVSSKDFEQPQACCLSVSKFTTKKYLPMARPKFSSKIFVGTMYLTYQVN